MPDRRRHRGPHPEDARLFAAAAVPALSRAVADLAWLRSRGYPPDAALTLVGDRFGLDARQRNAVRRACCSDAQRAARRARRVDAAAAAGAAVWVDGFNVLVTVEAALAGGVLLRCRDGCTRDMASMHGSYRRTAETDAALAALATTLDALRPAAVRWLLDRPVSNSGRLAERVRAAAPPALRGVWSCELHDDPDALLSAAPDGVVVASADSAVLDGAPRWLDLATPAVARAVPDAPVLRLDDSVESPGHGHA